MTEQQLLRAKNELITQQCLSTEQKAIRCVLLGAVESQLHNWHAAEQLLLQVEEMKNDIKHEIWTIPYSRYELAIVWRAIDKGMSERAASKLQKVQPAVFNDQCPNIACEMSQRKDNCAGENNKSHDNFTTKQNSPKSQIPAFLVNTHICCLGIL
eukprot:m.197176 g.197176  ORF g.197176 m.197176 type:complete len:155 (-) comp16824_c0_seq8:2392-2856(-)